MKAPVGLLSDRTVCDSRWRGLALLDESSGFPRLHYVFDVSDTGVRRNSRDPEVWQFNDDLKQPVSEMLSKTYGISGERVSQQLADVAGKLVADYNQQCVAGKGEVLKDDFRKRKYLKIWQHGVHPHQLSAGVQQHPNGTAYCADGYKERPKDQKMSSCLIPRVWFHFVFLHNKKTQP